MTIEIIQEELSFDLYGLAGPVTGEDYGAIGVPLMDRMWAILNQHKVGHKGVNHWVYLENRTIFVGVELETGALPPPELRRYELRIPKYATYEHRGPYHQLKQVNDRMKKEITDRGLVFRTPCVEIYGHWEEDETKLRTRLIWRLQ